MNTTAEASTLTKTLPQELGEQDLLTFCQQQSENAAKYIMQLRQDATQKDQTIQKHRAYENKIHEIATNRDMTYSDRILWMITLKNHSEDLLALKAFQPNISRLRQESGVSPDSATKFFASMHEAKAIKYSNKPQENPEKDNYTSVSTIVPLADHTQANTRAAALRIKHREEVKRRRTRKLQAIPPCEHCKEQEQSGNIAAITPLCKKCSYPIMKGQEKIPVKNIRIIEEETIPPTHEFSDPENSEWIEDDDTGNELLITQTSDTSHEFSEPPASSTNIVTPSHEFSEPLVNSTNTVTPSHEFSEPPVNSTNTVAPSHEFSEPPVNSTNTVTPSHEFSEPLVNSTNTVAPSHEFSEGMRVNTPTGIGTIAFIGIVKGRTLYRIRTNTLQKDGTYYATHNANEIQPIVQATLL